MINKSIKYIGVILLAYTLKRQPRLFGLPKSGNVMFGN